MPLRAPNFPFRGAICGSEGQFREEEQGSALRGEGTAASELESSARLALGGRAWPVGVTTAWRARDRRLTTEAV